MGTIKGVNTVEDLKAWLPNAQIPEQVAREADEPPKAGELIQPAIFAFPNWNTAWKLLTPTVIHVAIRTVSEINARDWKGRQKRTKEARKAVREAVGPHLGLLEPFAEAFANGKALRVVFTRLGGRKMDRSNLPTATKACEDAIAYLLGADDGDARWHSLFEQEPGGPVGVRITIEEYPV